MPRRICRARCATLAAALNEQEPRRPASRNARRAPPSSPRGSTQIVHAEENEGARSVEITQRGFTLSLLPFDVARALRGAGRAARARPGCSPRPRCRVGEDFAHFTSRLGLDDAETLAIAEPVRFRVAGAALSAARSCRIRRRPAHTGAVVDVAVPLIEASRGRRVRAVHQPSRAAARGAAAARALDASSPTIRCWCRARRRASSCCARFRESGNAVLLGTASFWEGVDVKGDALRLVIIEKLPFSSPDDALTKARIEHLQGQRRQCVPGVPAARGGARAQAGRRPAHPQRDGSRRGGHLRSAPRRQTLRPRVSRQPAADAGDARGGRRGEIPAAHRRARAAAPPR